MPSPLKTSIPHVEVGLSVPFTYKNTELLEEKTDPRSGLGNGQDISLSNIIKGFFSPLNHFDLYLSLFC